MRPAVGILRRVGEHAVIAPVPRARKLADRHDLDGRDAQVAQVLQPGDDRLERPLRREGADVQLVKHQVLAAHALPIPIGPGEPLREHHRRGPVDPLGLPERTGIGPLGAAVEPVGIAQAGGYARPRVTVDSRPLPSPSRPRAATRRRSGRGLTRSALGAQTRHRTESSPYPIAPHRRAGRPSFQSFMAAVFASFLGIVIDQTAGTRIDVPAGPRFVPAIPQGISLIRCAPPREGRVLGEVAQVAGPGARRFPANRAEDRIPQTAVTHHASAGICSIYLLHGRSALPRFRMSRSRRQESDTARIGPQSDLTSMRLARPSAESIREPSSLTLLHLASRMPSPRRAATTTVPRRGFHGETPRPASLWAVDWSRENAVRRSIGPGAGL